MIEFNLTNEQKKGALTSVLMGLESEIYNLLLILGHDPDSSNDIDFSIFANSQAPSTEFSLYEKYTKYISFKEKLNSL